MTKQEEETIATAIRELVEHELANGKCARPDWIVQSIVGGWDPPGGVDANKWTLCGYANVRALVRNVVRKWSPIPIAGDDGDSQLALPGYEKLHRAYLISRGGEQAVVRVDQLTVEEAFGIIDELTRTETGIRIHKEELLRYIDEVLLPQQARRTSSS